MKGSRRGYNADIEEEDEGSAAHVTSSSTADDTSTRANTGSDEQRVRNTFYSHVVPKRRRKKIRHSSNYSSISSGGSSNNNSKHQPAIDMSLVSLLTSKELDTRKRTHHSQSDDDSSTSGNSQVIDYKTIVNETKQAYSFVTDGPLVVIDYGSIELGSGSLLDSIYKISDDTSGGAVTSTQHGSSSNDVIIGRRRFSINTTKTTRQTGSAAARCGTSAILSSGSFNRSPEFASLHSSILLFVNVPTTLEAAIAFSPYARVLFCAQAPHTVLHANAAYVTLAQKKGIANPCIAGRSFSSRYLQILNDIGGDNNSEAYISQIVSDHVRAILDNTEAKRRPSQTTTASISSSHHPTCGNVKIFRIMSSDQTYSRFIRDYTNAFQQSMQTLGLSNANALNWDALTKSISDSNQHHAETQRNVSESVTHYLLQIEPGITP